jgi:uncharacterized protein (TIGR02996 family)
MTPRPLPDRLPTRAPIDPYEEALLRDCLALPWDQGLRLVYADWLDDQGQAVRADYIRTELAMEHWGVSIPPPAEVIAWRDEHLFGQLRFHRGLPTVLQSFNDPPRKLSLSLEQWGPWVVRLDLQNLYGGSAGVTLDPGIDLVRDLRMKPLSVSVGRPENPLGPEGARTLALSPTVAHLTSLHLESQSLGEEGVAALAGGPGLRELRMLRLAACDVPVSSLQFLLEGSAFPLLESLDLSGNGWREPNPELFRSLPAGVPLTTLRLAHNSLSPGAVEALTASPAARTLRFLDSSGVGGSGFGDMNAKALATGPPLPCLEILDLRSNGIYPGGFAALARSEQFPALRCLRLGNNRLTDQAIPALLEAPWLPGLECLDLSLNGFHDDVIASLLESPAIRGLIALDLSRNWILEAGLRKLMEGPPFTRLRWLGLEANNFEAKAGRELARSPAMRGVHVVLESGGTHRIWDLN